MMLFSLIKKDFLIAKKYVLLMLILAVVIPLFMLWQLPEFAGILGFMLSAIFASFMLLQYVYQKEYQFSKAAALLCAAPFSRKTMVLSKYIFFIVIYMICCLIFWIETLFIYGLRTSNLRLFALTFLATSVFISVYLPVQYKLGYDRAKFAFIAVFMASPITLSLLLKTETLNLNFLSMISPYPVFGIVLISFFVLAISTYISMRIYDKTDL
ncbi:MAG: ABC-2 transporter permease [Lachnospiraceae bacterium]|nr:ABC-2 transporter permease [Lachnospiraceae bacterium]